MADDIRKPLNQPKIVAGSDQEDTIASLKEQVSKLEAILMATIRAQPQVSPDTLWAKQHQEQVKIKEELDRLAAHFSESCQQRTQWEANKLNPDAKRLFKVSVGWCPEIILRANDDVMAKAYYDKVCGIRAVKPDLGRPETTTYSIVEVTNDAEAQKIVASEWSYKAAA